MSTSSLARDYQTGLAHFVTGRRGEACSAFQSILRRRPEDPDALHMLGLIAQQEGRGEEAIGLLRRALAARPVFPPARNNLGLVLEARLDQPAICQIVF